jgi:hypothetical protein
MPETDERIHELAEAILAPLLAAQGRDPHDYTSMEYTLAAEKAQAEIPPPEVVADETLVARIERLEARAGLRRNPTPIRSGIVKRIGDDRWLLGAREMTTAELDQELDRQGKLIEERNQLDRELGFDQPPVIGQEIHDKAMQNLKSRGILAPSEKEILAAYIEAQDS